MILRKKEEIHDPSPFAVIFPPPQIEAAEKRAEEAEKALKARLAGIQTESRVVSLVVCHFEASWWTGNEISRNFKEVFSKSSSSTHHPVGS